MWPSYHRDTSSTSSDPAARPNGAANSRPAQSIEHRGYGYLYHVGSDRLFFNRSVLHGQHVRAVAAHQPAWLS